MPTTTAWLTVAITTMAIAVTTIAPVTKAGRSDPRTQPRDDDRAGDSPGSDHAEQ